MPPPKIPAKRAKIVLACLYYLQEKMGGNAMQGRAAYAPRSEEVDLTIYDAPGAPRMSPRTIAEQWAAGMENADGTAGPHWTLDQAKQIMAQKNVGGNPWKFWTALNATYSDLCEVFKKHGISNLDAYVDFARAFWLEDEDAVPDKLAAYYTYVTKH